MITSFLDPVFYPLLQLGPFWAVFIASLFVSLAITLIYKWVTDQELMKTLKEDMKKIQEDVKKLKNNPAKMMEKQKEVMEKNMKYMMHSLKPTLITFIPLLIIFGWLNSNLGYEPIHPGQEFTTTIQFKEGTKGEVKLLETEGLEILGDNPKKIENDQVSWTLKGAEGDYALEYEFGDKKYENQVIVTEGRQYAAPLKKIKDDLARTITVSNKKIIVMAVPIIGWKIGWLGSYIIFSLVFSMALRKILKVH